MTTCEAWRRGVHVHIRFSGIWTVVCFSWTHAEKIAAKAFFMNLITEADLVSLVADVKRQGLPPASNHDGDVEFAVLGTETMAVALR